MTDDLFFFHFFIEIENFRGESKILMRHTHDTTFSEKNLDFYKILEEKILMVKKGRSERSDATPFLTNKISLNIL
jgi:hypothetical protein